MLATPGISAALVGARDEAQAKENALAASVRLSASEYAELEEIFPALSWVASAPDPAEQ